MFFFVQVLFCNLRYLSYLELNLVCRLLSALVQNLVENRIEVSFAMLVHIEPIRRGGLVEETKK